MNKFKRLTALVLAVVMSVTMLASCGNKVEEPPVDNPGVSDVTPATEPTVSSDPVVTTNPDDTSAPITSDTTPSTEPDVTTTPEPTTSATTPTPTTTKDDGSFTVEDMSSTMYATESVNVRSGPSSNYDKVGRFNKGDAVTVTGRASTGWFRVLINGKTAYVSNAYLSDKKPEPITTTKKVTSSTAEDPDIDLDDDYTVSQFEGFGDPISDNCLEYTVSRLNDSRYETAIRQILEGVQNFMPRIYIDPVIEADEAYDFAAQILPIINVEYCFVKSFKAHGYSDGENEGKIHYVDVTYYCEDVFEGLEMVSELKSKTDSVLEKVKKSWSDYQKVKYVHDWIVLNATADEDNVGGTWAASAYGAIVDGRPTCLGYAKATFYMLSKLGFDVVFDIGMGTSAKHIWVKVKVDGEWYCLDTTWGDPVDPTKVDKNYVRYDYFLQTDDYMTETHADNFDMRFYSEPKANSINLNWFVVNDCYIEDADDAERILRNAAKKAVEGGDKYEYIRVLCASVDIYDAVLAEYGGKKMFNNKILSDISSKYSCDDIWGGTKKAYPDLHQRTLTFRIKK